MGLGRGVFRLAAMAAATIWLAGCMTAAVGPEHPGTRVRYKSPDPQKWIGNQAFGDRRATFRCRPLAWRGGGASPPGGIRLRGAGLVPPWGVSRHG